MKIIKTIVALIALPLLLNGQKLTPFDSYGLWGYKDSLGGFAIEPQYDFAGKFHENYAVILDRDLLGAIDKSNNQIIPPQYEYLKYLGNEYFAFGTKEVNFGYYKQGIITSQNHIVIPPIYDNVYSVNDNFIIAKVMKKNTEIGGNMIHTTISDLGYGMIDTFGNVILEPIYEKIRFLENGYLVVRKKNRYSAFFDEKFNQLTEYEYLTIQEPYNGLFRVKKNDYYGYLNMKGEEVIECKYELNSIFIDNFAVVKNNGKAGLINLNDEIILDFKYQELGIPYKNHIPALDDQKWGMVSLEGDILLPFMYENKISELKGITAFFKDEKWSVWDYDKVELLPTKYDEIKLVEGDEKFVSFYGRTEEKKYSQSIAFVRMNEYWGVINDKGEILIPVIFDEKELFEKIKTL